MPEHALTRGVHHLGLTVPSIEETREFFMNVLDFQKVGEKPNYPAVFLSDGTVMLTLWQAHDPQNVTAFNRKGNVGLHHVALRVKDDSALSSLRDALEKAPGVDIEFAPEALGTSGALHMMCTVPGGIRVEFIAVP